MTIISPETIAAWNSSPYALAILAILSFTESAFFIIPPEVMFLPMALLNPANAIPLSLFISVASILGAAFGYWVGLKGGKPVLKKLFSDSKIEKVSHLYQKYDVWAIAVAAFTPIPFKVFTVAAGVFDISFKRMILVASVFRTLRYLILGVLIFAFGESITYFIEHQLDMVLLVGTVAGIALFLGYKFVYPRIEAKAIHLTLRDRLRALLRIRS